MIIDYLFPFTAGNAVLGVGAFVLANMFSQNFESYLGFNQGPYKNESWGALGYSAFWMVIIILDYGCAEEILKKENLDDWCSWKRLSNFFKPSGNYVMPDLDASTYCKPLGDMDWETVQFNHNLKDAARMSGWTAATWKT